MKEESKSDTDFEKELLALIPSAVDPDVMNRWLADIQEADTNAPKPQAERRGESDENSRSYLGFGLSMPLAALVCLTGFIAGLLFLDFSETSGERPSASIPRLGKALGPPLFQDLSFEPNTLENRFVSVNDDGVVGVLGEVPFRRVRYQLTDSYQWKNPEDGSRLEMIIPREEILLLPVVTY